MSSHSWYRLARVWLALWLGLSVLWAAPPSEPVLLNTAIDATGRFSVEWEGHAAVYYRLWRATTLGGERRCVAMTQGENGPQRLRDPLPVTQQGYYWLEQLPVGSATDTDGDGLSDEEELPISATANPLNPATAIPLKDGAISIPDRATFDTLAHRDNFPGAMNVQEVKFLIAKVHTDHPELYFLNTNTRVYHINFARDVLNFEPQLDYWEALTLFNSITYVTNTNRQFIAGSLVYYPAYESTAEAPGIFAVEFWPTDTIAERFVRLAVEMVSAATPFMDRPLAYHPAGETQRTLYNVIEKDEYAASPVPVISTEELFSQVSYSMLNEGTSYGRLKLVNGPEALSVRDIPIFRTVPNDLTRVAGIITATPQTPLSHINLKAKQNKTPNCYLKDADTNPQLLALVDKYVQMTVAPEGLTVREATQEEVDRYFESIRPPNPQTPPRNLAQRDIKRTSQISFYDSTAYGAKAANLSQMKHWEVPDWYSRPTWERQTYLPAGCIPEGWAVPFYFYDEFMKYNNFYHNIELMLAEEDFKQNPAVRERRLKRLRDMIEAGEIPYWQKTAFDVVMASYPAGTSLRCRSSTNNEDLPNFNGAGLYNSYTHHPHEGHLSKTIKQVWAGLWNYRAFEEREFQRIDHFAAAMGVLIHPNFKGEIANGVAVSKNIFDPNWAGSYVNVQVGEALVTNPPPNAVPEEFLIANLGLGNQDRYEIQYTRFSNLVPAGTTLLSRQQAWDLADMLAAIRSRFRSLYARYDNAFAMEIEFKVTADQQIVIKQARPWVE